MADKRCPECGLWNTEIAEVCECGFNFATGAARELSPPDLPPASSTFLKGGLYATLGALLAFLPVSIGKTALYLVGICGHVSPYNPHFPIGISTCGITLYSLSFDDIFFLSYFVLALLGGALSGILTISIRRGRLPGDQPNPSAGNHSVYSGHPF